MSIAASISDLPAITIRTVPRRATCPEHERVFHRRDIDEPLGPLLAERRLKALDGRDGVLVLAAHLLLVAVELLFSRLNVSKDEFGFDHADIANRVDLAHAVHDVIVVEAADDVNDGVALSDIGKEVVALAFALRGAGDEAGDVNDVDRGRDDDFGASNGLQFLHAFIGDEHDADIRLNRAKRVILCCNTSFGKGIEQS